MDDAKAWTVVLYSGITFGLILCIIASYIKRTDKKFLEELEKEKKRYYDLQDKLANCKEDSIVIDGVKYIREPIPLYRWVIETRYSINDECDN